MSPQTDRGEWISRDPRELSTGELLEDLLGYDDGLNGRGLRHSPETAPSVNGWIRTPRGRELAYRLDEGQRALGKQMADRHYDYVPTLDRDPRYVPEDEPMHRRPAGPDRSGMVIVYAAGAILAGLILIGVLALAASRSGQTTAAPDTRGGTTAGAGDPFRSSTGSSAAQSGAPRDRAEARLRLPVGPLRPGGAP